MSIFGARIIGKEAFDKQKKAQKTGADIYGFKVTGGPRPPHIPPTAPPRSKPDPAEPAGPPRANDSALEEENARLRAQLDALQDRASAPDNPDPEPVPETEPEPEPETDPGSLSIDEIADCLKKQPELYDRMLDQELRRKPPKGPRKGAAKILAEYEQERDGGPREDVMDELIAVISG